MMPYGIARTIELPLSHKIQPSAAEYRRRRGKILETDAPALREHSPSVSMQALVPPP
jgi:hypothetical protein